MNWSEIDYEKLQVKESESNVDEPVEKLPFDASDERCKKLKQIFQDSFKRLPDFIVSVPGRVNLIGEHVDYSGYGVIPMALEQRIYMALGKSGTQETTLINVDEKFERAVIGGNFSGCQKPLWYHYFQCGVQGALNYSEAMKYSGMDVIVWGNIPPSAGLSSSSALVCAAAICMFLLNEPTVRAPGKKQMAELCAKAEHLIGTQGGGMDQAIAFFAREGCAKHIEFHPLRCADVQLPKNSVFVIAHSMVEKNKAASNDFNIRVVECRLAAQVIAKHQGHDWRTTRTLSDLQRKLKMNPKKILELLESILHDAAYDKNEIANVLEIGSDELVNISMSKDTKDVNVLHLKKRACHVYSEVARVLEFKYCCQSMPEESCIVELGKLLNESHESLKNLYECSHHQLDKLVAISRPYTSGARVTGAGWGGCIVTLTTADRLAEYMEALKTKYYSGLGVGDSEFGNYVFVTKPRSGASVQYLSWSDEIGRMEKS